MIPSTSAVTAPRDCPIDQRSGWVRWEDVRRGGYDPAARIEEQEQDGVNLEILYPTPRIGNQLVWHRDDADFHIACIRAYNDWLAEFCAYNPERLWGVAILPNVGAEAAVSEMHRVAAFLGIRGVMLGRWPSGDEVLATKMTTPYSLRPPRPDCPFPFMWASPPMLKAM